MTDSDAHDDTTADRIADRGAEPDPAAPRAQRFPCGQCGAKL